MNRRGFLKLLASTSIIGAVTPPAFVRAASLMPLRPWRLHTSATGYVVFDNFDLTDFGNRVPAIEVGMLTAQTRSRVFGDLKYVGGIVHECSPGREWYAGEEVIYQFPPSARIAKILVDGKEMDLRLGKAIERLPSKC